MLDKSQVREHSYSSDKQSRLSSPFWRQSHASAQFVLVEYGRDAADGSPVLGDLGGTGAKAPLLDSRVGRRPRRYRRVVCGSAGDGSPPQPHHGRAQTWRRGHHRPVPRAAFAGRGLHPARRRHHPVDQAGHVSLDAELILPPPD